MGYQRMFTVGLVYTRDHGPGCSVAGVQNRLQNVQEVGLFYMLIQESNMKEGARTPLGTPGGSQIEPKV